MAEAQQEQEVDTVDEPFPRPPPYFESFTSTNLERLQRLRDEAGAEESSSPVASTAATLSLPEELEYLVPPPEPVNGVYRTFGETRYKAVQLAPLDADIPILHSNQPGPAELVKLTRASLLAFLQLVHTLTTNPDNVIYTERWEELRDIMFNAHQALNLYRPWAARESLIKLMEQWVQRAKDEVAVVDQLDQRTGELMAAIRRDAHEVGEKDDNQMDVDDRSKGTRAGANGTKLRTIAKSPEDSAEETMLLDIQATD